MSDKALSAYDLERLRELWNAANEELDDDASDAWDVMCAKAGNDLLRLQSLLIGWLRYEFPNLWNLTLKSRLL